MCFLRFVSVIRLKSSIPWAQNIYSILHSMGQLFFDPFLQIFDLRYNRSMGRITSPATATQIKLHPKFSSSLAVMSDVGEFYLLDIRGDLSTSSAYEVSSKLFVKF
jgi:hypothetical protein